MNKKKLFRSLSLNDNNTSIYKTNFVMEEGGSEICALLNTQGGFIVVELTDFEKLPSIEKDIIKDLSPSSLVYFEDHYYEDRHILVIEVPAGKDIPYSYRDNIYIREGDKTKKADITTIRDMILRKDIEPERWERRFSDANVESDIDEKYFRTTLTSINEKNRIRFPIHYETIGTLQLLSVSKYGRLTNAGDV